MDGSINLEKASEGVSLIIPAFNEAAGIAEMIASADAALASVSTNFEILVIDDGSRDDTYAIAGAACSGRPNVRVIRHEENQGYGVAIRTGFQAAKLDLVVFTDADHQFDLTEIPRFILLSRDYDVICGYRMERQDPWLRKVYSKAYNLLVTALLGTQVRDIDYAFKMFHRCHLDKLTITTDGFLVNTELLTMAKQSGLSVIEVGVTHLPRVLGHSTVSIADVMPVLTGLLRFWWNRVMFAGTSTPPVERENRNQWRWAFPLIALLSGFLLFANLGYPLIDRDETRYAEIPREMLVSGDWISPQLNFEPYYDKPPLMYWLCAASYKVLGVSAWSARLVPAIAAFLLLLTTMWFGVRMFDRRIAALSGCILITTFGFIVSGRFLIIDGLLSLLVALSMFAGYEAVRKGVFDWRWWIISSLCCGFGVLAKGPIAGVLLGPPLLIFAWLTDSSSRIRVHHWLAFAAISLTTAGVWFAMAADQDARFLYEFFYRHNIARFAGAYHARPSWFFIPVALAGGHPWTCLLVPYLLFLSRRSWDVGSRRPPVQGFLLLWVCWCLLFFSMSRCKLPTYILPTAPAFALLVAHYLDHVIFRASQCDVFSLARRLSPMLSTVITCLAGIVLSVVAFAMKLSSDTTLVIAVVVWSAAAILLILTLKKFRDSRVSWASCFVAALMLIVQGTQAWLPQVGRTDTLIAPASDLVKWTADKNLRVATFAHEWSGLPFYSRRNDIKNFRLTESEALSDFVASQASTVIVIQGNQQAKDLIRVLPERLRVTLLEKTADTSVVLAESRPIQRTSQRLAGPQHR